MRGTHTDIPAVGRAVLHTLQPALDDLKKQPHFSANLQIADNALGIGHY